MSWVPPGGLQPSEVFAGLAKTRDLHSLEATGVIWPAAKSLIAASLTALLLLLLAPLLTPT